MEIRWTMEMSNSKRSQAFFKRYTVPIEIKTLSRTIWTTSPAFLKAKIGDEKED